MLIRNPDIFVRFVRGLSCLVPRAFRADWRREWEAEIISRWQRLEKWNRLTMKTKIDLTRNVSGAARDALWFQQKRTRMALAILNLLFALLLGFGAVQDLAIRGVRDSEVKPFLLSSAAIVVSVLFIISAVAMLKNWSNVRGLVIVTGVLSILVHLYGALPPHRIMGLVALLVGVGYAAVMLFVFERNRGRDLAV